MTQPDTLLPDALSQGPVLQNTVLHGLAQRAWAGYLQTLNTIIERYQVRSLCDLGGGANPALSLDEIAARGLDYTLLDVCSDELAKAPAGYKKLRADICQPGLELSGSYDLVISKMLLEHVPDGWQFHRNVLGMLKPGGLAFHFFPTLFCPPFLANRLLAPGLTGRLLNTLAPRDSIREKKFPAYYSWCRGPSARQLGRLERLGYEVVAYHGFFGHGYYSHVPGLRTAHRWLSDWLVRHPIAPLTSYAYQLLRRPLAS